MFSKRSYENKQVESINSIAIQADDRNFRTATAEPEAGGTLHNARSYAIS